MLLAHIRELNKSVLPQTDLLSNIVSTDYYGYLSQSGKVSALFEMVLKLYGDMGHELFREHSCSSKNI